MSTAKQVIEQGHEQDVNKPGWEVVTALFDATGKLVATDIAGGLTWSESLTLSFQHRQSFKEEGYTYGHYIMAQESTGWRVKIEIRWRGVASLEVDEIPF